MNAPIDTIVIEHQPLTRLGLRSLLEGEDDISLVGEADTAPEGFRLFRDLHPDVTILGLRFPDHCTIDDLDRYFEHRPKAKIIVMADHAGDAEIAKALKKGAAGFVCKDAAAEEIVRAIRVVASGRKYIPAEVAQLLSENIGQEELTPTEAAILGMIVAGMSNKAIAISLGISENTVKTHNQNIFGKIGVSDRTSAATTAIRRGLVRTDL